MKKHSVLLSCASATAVLLLSGCATDQMQREIAEVRTIAQDAKASAQTSADAAASAMSKAEAAATAAESAKETAEASQTCCDDSRERLDRVFRKTMNK